MQINKTIRRYTPPLDFVTDIYVADDNDHCPAINTTDGSSFFPDRTQHPTKIVPVVLATSKDGTTKYGMECVKEVEWRAFFKGQTLADGADAPELRLQTKPQGTTFETSDWALDTDGYSLLFRRNITGTWSFYMTGSFVNPRTGAITPVKTPPVILTCAQQATESFNLTADRPTSEVYDTLIDDSLVSEYATGVMQEGLTTADAHNRKVTYKLRVNGSTKAIPQNDATHPWDLLVFQQSVNAQGKAVSTLVSPIISGTNNKPFDPLVSYQPNKPEVRFDALFADKAQFRVCARDAKDCVTISVCEANFASPTTAQTRTATAYIKDGKLYATNVEGSTAITCTSVPWNGSNDYSAACVKVGDKVLTEAAKVNVTTGLILVAVNLKAQAATATLYAKTFISVPDVNLVCTFLTDHQDDEDTAICIFSRDAIREDTNAAPIFQALAQYYGLYDTGTLSLMNPYRGFFALIATPRGGKRILAETQYGWAWKTAMPSFEGKGIITGGDFDKDSQSTQGVKVLMDYRGQALTKPTIGLFIDWRVAGNYVGSGEQKVVNIPANIGTGDLTISCDVNRKGVAKVLSLDDTGNTILTDEKGAILYTF